MFLTKRFLIALTALLSLTALGMLWPIFYKIGVAGISLFLLASLKDLLSLYGKAVDVICEREMQSRFSNGDPNPITLHLRSSFKRPVKVKIIDEVPVEFQERNFSLNAQLVPSETVQVRYELTPKRRGSYDMGNIHLYVSSLWGLLERRFTVVQPASFKVYPSFMMIRNMEILSVENKAKVCGIKQVRRIGSSTEFDQIKEYVAGDDYRTINWKASARKHQLMSNLYTDEQSQQIFNVIDKGRGMQHTFHKMSLLDYAINASLALSYLAIQHSDHAGLISFEQNVDTYVPASSKSNQLELLMHFLHKESTTYIQSDYSVLYEHIHRKVNKRSLFVIYTTFDTNISMERQLPYLRKLAASHVVLVVFFQDDEMSKLVDKKPNSTEDYFIHVSAANIEFEKRMIVKNLRRYGIRSILTRPENLTVDVINKYLDLKAQRVI